MRLNLMHGDSYKRLAELPADSVEMLCCDPPYDLTSGGQKGFMGKDWDGTGISFDPVFWKLCYRVLRPDGVLKAFGGTRTFHRMASAIQRAGFVDLTVDVWAYGSGFPKSLNVSKKLDSMAGATRGTRKVAFTGNALLRSGGQNTRPWMEKALESGFHELPDDTPITEASVRWKGWGTALKPAWEPVVVGRKKTA